MSLYKRGDTYWFNFKHTHNGVFTHYQRSAKTGDRKRSTETRAPLPNQDRERGIRHQGCRSEGFQHYPETTFRWARIRLPDSRDVDCTEQKQHQDATHGIQRN